MSRTLKQKFEEYFIRYPKSNLNASVIKNKLNINVEDNKLKEYLLNEEINVNIIKCNNRYVLPNYKLKTDTMSEDSEEIRSEDDFRSIASYESILSRQIDDKFDHFHKTTSKSLEDQQYELDKRLTKLHSILEEQKDYMEKNLGNVSHVDESSKNKEIRRLKTELEISNHKLLEAERKIQHLESENENSIVEYRNTLNQSRNNSIMEIRKRDNKIKELLAKIKRRDSTISNLQKQYEELQYMQEITGDSAQTNIENQPREEIQVNQESSNSRWSFF